MSARMHSTRPSSECSRLQPLHLGLRHSRSRCWQAQLVQQLPLLLLQHQHLGGMMKQRINNTSDTCSIYVIIWLFLLVASCSSFVLPTTPCSRSSTIRSYPLISKVQRMHWSC